MVEIQELKRLIGRPYTLETARLMKYGGTVNSKGIIVEVEAKKATKRPNCRNGFVFTRTMTPEERIKKYIDNKFMFKNTK